MAREKKGINLSQAYRDEKRTILPVKSDMGKFLAPGCVFLLGETGTTNLTVVEGKKGAITMGALEKE